MVLRVVCGLLLNRRTLAVGLIAIAFRTWYSSTIGVCTSKRRLDGLTALVTGANTGIGLETARDLARRGARVLLACRDPQRGQQAVELVRAVASNTASVELLPLDLMSLDSVRACAAKVLAKESRLDILINNAGAGGLGHRPTRDGLHVGLQVNYFGPFLLTLLLVDLMKKSAPSRIVFVSSILHEYATLKVEMLDLSRAQVNYDVQLYAISKLLNVVTANELARRLHNTDVTVNSLHPGAVYTDIFRNAKFGMNTIIKIFFGCFFKNPVQGAQTSIHLAVSEEVEGVTGRYFEDCKEKRPNKQAHDRALAQAVWEKSERLVGLKDSERPSFTG